MKTPNWSYTNVKHSLRKRLGITPMEYFILDYIYWTSTHPKYRDSEGYCNQSYQNMADFLGFSRRGVIGACDKCVQMGLLETHPDGRKRTTEKWYGDAYEDKGFTSEQSAPVNESGGEQSAPLASEQSALKNGEIGEQSAPHKKKEKEKKKEVAASLSDFEKIETAKMVLTKAIKPKERAELLEGFNFDFPTIAEKIATTFVIDGKTLNPNSPGSVKGLVSYAKIYIANTPKEENEAKVFKMIDRVDEVCFLFQKYMIRIPSERSKKLASYKIRELMKSGETLDDFEQAFQLAKASHGDVWKDFEYTINNYKRLKTMKVWSN